MGHLGAGDFGAVQAEAWSGGGLAPEDGRLVLFVPVPVVLFGGMVGPKKCGVGGFVGEKDGARGVRAVKTNVGLLIYCVCVCGCVCLCVVNVV